MAEMATEQVLHMNGGEGETSYANNSLLPKKVMMRARPALEESIKRLCCTITLPNCLKVADLGCSSGPNALLAVSNIINIVTETSRSLKLEIPIFQFFLNDLFGNDFNTIFRSLPEFYQTLKQDKREKAPTCFINATPGTFYGSLFPSNSIHFFHSSYSLHWLSQAPKGLSAEEKLPIDEKGNIYVTSINPPSYAKQFQEDFKLFLRSRSEELVLGGGMFITFIGRYDASVTITSSGLIFKVLNDMVLENLIEEATVESFSIPHYTPTTEEVSEIIKEEGSFRVQRLESIKTSWDGSGLDEDGSECFVDDNMRGEVVTKCLRAVMEPLLKAHFGDGIMDELFLRFENKVVQLIGKLEHPTLVISLIKITSNREINPHK